MKKEEQIIRERTDIVSKQIMTKLNFRKTLSELSVNKPKMTSKERMLRIMRENIQNLVDMRLGKNAVKYLAI